MRRTTAWRPCGSRMEAFDRLHPQVRKWVREQGWSELRPVQVSGIEAVLGHDRDVLISASTAAGKTEAVFLPLLTRAAERETPGLSILYVSPLKALINDQHRRLELLTERLELPVAKWHGDAPAGPKARIMKSPGGVVLITPESVEALFLRRTRDAERLFAGLDAIVIDELHAFLQGPRGLHLASLLRRIDLLIGRRVRRIGLSATLADLTFAATWMNPQAPDTVDRVAETAGSPELRLQVRGYEEPPESDPGADAMEGEAPQALDVISDHLFETLRGDNHLVFGGSRRTVEALSNRLLNRSDQAKVPNEFFPHHGSLSKELREELERRLKAGSLPTTGVATTTLELGIDLGSVKSVAQIGAPRSLAGLRQRLGRSGRRAGAPAILRLYTRERHLGRALDPLDRLRPQTVRAVAAVRLLLARFLESPQSDPAVVTVLIHQLLSVIVERGGVKPDGLYRILCEQGPLSSIEIADFIELLRHLATPGMAVIEQSPDGLIMLGPEGEALTSAREFYAVFETDQEWKLLHGARPLGQIPISNVLAVGSLLAFAGRRWRVVDVDDRARVLSVAPHPSGRLPKFDRQSNEPLDDRILEEMRKVYLDADMPEWLDAQSLIFLAQGREAFADLDLERTGLVRSGGDTHVLLWRGTAMNNVVAVALTAAGIGCEAHDLGVTLVDTTATEARRLLTQLGGAPSAQALSEFVENLQSAKYDHLAPTGLLQRLWARRHAVFCDELPAIAAVAQTWPA